MCSPFLYSKSQMDKAVSDALDSTRKELEVTKNLLEKAMNHFHTCSREKAKLKEELEELRVLHKIAWTNEKKLAEELEALQGKIKRMIDAFDPGNNMDVNEAINNLRTAVEKPDVTKDQT